MGANQSYEDVLGELPIGEKRERSNNPEAGHHHKKRKAKPAAPHRPSVTAVTHNAVSLTWLPPRHALHATIAYTVDMCKPRQSRQWLTLTKTCQGTRYEARHLDTDTDYVFRVRAENIFGTGKPSAPSEIVTTKIFEMSSDLSCYISPSPSSSSSSPAPSSSLSPYSDSSSSSGSNRGFPKSFSYEGGLLLDGSENDFHCSGSSIISNGGVGGGTMVKSLTVPLDNNSTCSVSSSSSSSFGGGGGGGGGGHYAGYTSTPNSRQYGSVRRRHSFNVRLEGRVSSILSHHRNHSSSSSSSDNYNFLFSNYSNNNSLHSSTSTIVTNTSGDDETHHNNNNNINNNIYSNGNHGNNDSHNTSMSSSSSSSNHQVPRSSNKSILRSHSHRSATLQSSRKSSVPILLPGTGSNSLNRLRESRSSLKSNNCSPSSSGDVTTGNSQSHSSSLSSSCLIPRHRGVPLNNRTHRKSREYRSSLGSTASDSSTVISSSSSTSSSTTNSSSSSSSSSKEEGGSSSSGSNSGRTGQGQGSRLSLQSVLSDVTMSNHSQSSGSDDQSSTFSRPVSFSDIGDHSDLGTTTLLVSDKNLISDFHGHHTHLLPPPPQFLDVDDTQHTTPNNNSSSTDDSYDNHHVNEDDNTNNDNDDDDDDIGRLKRDLKNMEITEEKLKFHDLKERLKILSEEEDSTLTLNLKNTTTTTNNNNNNNNNNKNNNTNTNTKAVLLNQREYYQTLEDPWEKDTGSLDRVSENIMAAPFTDDIKMALNARNNSNSNGSINNSSSSSSHHHHRYHHRHQHGSNPGDVVYFRRMDSDWSRRGGVGGVVGAREVGHPYQQQYEGETEDDFRTLRSVLQSNQMIVKQSRSLPEVVGVVLGEGGETTTTLTRGKLTTIADEDEEEEAVRVTTL